MKKFFVILLVCLFSISSCSIAESASDGVFGYAPTVATNYIKWANEFAVSDLDLEYYYEPEVDELGQKTLYIDDLGIVYDNSNLLANMVVLFYMNHDTDALGMVNQWKRVSSLFCALQYGDPQQSDVDFEQAKQEADKYLTKMNDVMKEKNEDLHNGKPALFYVGNAILHQIAYIADAGQWVIIAN